jgi:arginyl-tRNA synthetase
VTPAELSAAVVAALRESVAAGDLTVPASHLDTLEVAVERPKSRDHGDYATSIALQLAKTAGRPPRAVAELIADRLGAVPGIKKAEIAGPGFLNITLDTAAQGEIVRTIATAGPGYGRNDALKGVNLNLEFVSANPTGPVHIGAVRWAAVGDALSRVLRAAGAEVGTEYYFNDAGSQIDRFARSLLATAQGVPVPEDGYAGDYIADIAAEVRALEPGVLDLPEAEALERFRVRGVDLMFTQIKQSLADFGVHFDVYFNEKDLHARGELDAAVTRLWDQGRVFERDGAIWLRTTDFGDDKDRVLKKSDGDWTYFAADCAYYLDKRERGFDKVVIMLGADHHGYIGRIKAMVACFGDDPEGNVEILIGQMVNLIQDGEPVRMSKRAGTVVTLEDLVDLIGVDAARYSLARSSADSNINLDVNLLTSRAKDNPVYYVQYAHARMCSVRRNAAEMGIGLIDVAEFNPGLLFHERESDLLGKLAEFPQVIATAGELREVHRVARYLEELAATYHRFYSDCQILPKGDILLPAELTQARMWLAEATQIVVANGLALLGVSAPERM